MSDTFCGRWRRSRERCNRQRCQRQHQWQWPSADLHVKYRPHRV